MAVPTFHGAGAMVTATSGSSIASVPYPASIAADDVAILDCRANNARTFTPPNLGTEWQSVYTQSNATFSTGIFWKRLTGSETSFNVTTNTASSTTNVAAARIYVWRGCIATGDPFEDATAGTLTTSQTMSSSTIDTTDVDRTVAVFAGIDNDAEQATDYSTLPGSGWTLDGSVLTWNQTGDGTMFAVSKTQATAGTVTGSTIAVYTITSSAWKTVTLALIPPAGGTDDDLAPATVLITVAVAAPALHITDTLAPSTVNVPVAVAAPTLGVGTNANLAPATVNVPVAVAAPTLAVGDTLAPATVVVAVNVGAPTLAGGDPTVTWNVVGAVTDTTAKVRQQLDAQTSATLKVSTASNLSSATTFSGAEIGTSNIFEFALTGLSAATTYYYGYGSTAQGSFKTAPASTGGSYNVVLGSCYNSGSTNSYVRMLAKTPEMVVHLGDTPYIDNTSNSQANYLSGWAGMLTTGDIAALLETAAFTYSWSDHDYGANNDDGTSSIRTYAQDAYRAIFPTYTLPGTDDEIYHSFAWGRVRWVMLDCFSERDPEGSGSPSTRTMLGASQLAWLLDLIETFTEPVMVLNVEEPWIIDGEDNGWDIYAGERETIANHIQQYAKGRVVIVHGDAHMLAWDDGTNSNYATTPVGNGPPVFCFAPIQNSNSVKGGPYSEGTWSSDTTQYGEIIVTDSGGDTLTLTVRGYSVTSSTTETQRFTTDLEFGQSLAPATVVVPVSVGAPSLTVGDTLAPATVTVAVAVGAPTLSGGTSASLAPATVSVPVAVPAPGLAVADTLAPATTNVAVLVAAPTLSAADSLAPATVPVPVAVAAPTLTAATGLAPATVNVATLVAAPTLRVTDSLAPGTVVVVVLVAAPTIGAVVYPSTGRATFYVRSVASASFYVRRIG